MPEDVTAASDKDVHDKDVLAGEYVLGTLNADERAAAQNLLAEDAEFVAKVKVWERRLGELHLMVDVIEPEPDLWARIQARLPEPEPQPQVETPEPEPEPESRPESQAEPGPPAETAVTLPEFKFDFDFAHKDERAAEPGLPPASPLPAIAEPVAEPPVVTDEQPSAISKADEAIADAIALPGLGPTRSEPPPGEPTPGEPVAARPPPEEPIAQTPVEPPASAPAPLPSFIAPKPRPPPASLEVEQKVRSLRRHLAGWRALAAIMALALLALAGLVAVWRYVPERVPPVLRPAELMRLAGISVDSGAPRRRPLPPESQFDE